MTLVGFISADIPYLQPTESQSVLVPVHEAIYGGYVMYAGAEFYAGDFNNPDYFAAKCANMLMFGAQIGWFSLIGRDNQGNYMGIYDELMSSQYDMEI